MAPDSASRPLSKRWLYWVIIAWASSFLIMAMFASYTIIRSQQINKELCKITDDNRTLLINILNAQRQQSLESATDIIERNIIRQRYNELRAVIPPLKCSTKGGPVELEP